MAAKNVIKLVKPTYTKKQKKLMGLIADIRKDIENGDVKSMLIATVSKNQNGETKRFVTTHYANKTDKYELHKTIQAAHLNDIINE